MSEPLQKGSVLGGVLLITGSCIGAGMLALPILSGIAGFIPSMVMFFLAGLFMTSTGLMLVEATSWFKRPVNILSLLEYTLGPIGKILGWFLYLFLFYALIVAYISGSGNHVGMVLHVPDWVGSLFFVALFGWIVYLGTRPVDLMNRFLMVGKIGAYICLMVLAIEYIHPKTLIYARPEYAFLALPVLVISFGFHNMVPSLFYYLGGDLKRVKQSLLGGVLFVFIIYIVWQIVAIGTIPIYGKNGILYSYIHDQDAAQSIKLIIENPFVGLFAQLLAFFAILTSFVTQSLSLVHFLRDGFKIEEKKRENIGLCIAALGPPLIFSLMYPQLFFKALNFAGGICAVILFGIFPVLMIWKGRYVHKETTLQVVRGGKPFLSFIFVIAFLILFYQASIMMGFQIFPRPTSY